MTPAALVRDARRSAGLTQAQLAERLGTTQPVIARLERADANPTFETVQRALDAAGFEIELRATQRSALPEVDESQILARLRLSPAERLRTFEASHRNLAAMLAAARRVPRDDLD
ncbi:helix-turn-helix domain-containing protein [Conexibacter sp. JD483]|uniref:helix-turn-helix domain-containing protein n=1 Tax=unclassified Conexibacter TaxID=2627773 RepID=UPI002718202C|nr:MULTISPECIES: helix-turn-helix domain-containing protein [unclassified Conexibacter]MDO8187637.1 helix-turn-helix domain-containing protein [Conexibacter sp. CPCC 205706]MDO8201031.1 helix-turn-helix domain-containing protein [Conexibacter sp. CPCC 205762]MDR9371204.1 helix-turn-helix domain-containing protein [Conexibacter sp. JD483]